MYESQILSTRISKEDFKKFDELCRNEKISRSILIKRMIKSYIEKDISETELLQECITKLIEDQEKQNQTLDLYLQFFEYFLTYFFEKHPDIGDVSTENKKRNILAANRKVQKMENLFMEHIYQTDKSMFDRMFANHVEGESND